MGEEFKMNDYENGGGSGDDDRVSDWEAGLPGIDDLTPLSQDLIPPDLALAFRISPEPSRSMLDVNRESQKTLSYISSAAGTIGHHHHHSPQALSSSNNFKHFKPFNDEATTVTAATQIRDHPMVIDVDEADPTRDASDSRKTRRVMDSNSGGAAAEEADSSAAAAAALKNNDNSGDDGFARTLKRPRLVWTPQLHKRFVDVVAHLGIKNAVPKTIMQLMNVEGLTRENVASHLQKYRLYLKRMQGLSNEDPPSSDHLFASTPVPQSLHESAGSGGAVAPNGGHGNSSSNGHVGMPISIPYPPPPPPGAQMMPMPMPLIGMPGPAAAGGFHGYEAHHLNHHHQFSMIQQQRDWSGNKFGSVVPFPHHVAPSDK